MRIVLISDTHEKHRQVKLPDGDILIHAGDMTGRGSVPALQEVNKWFGEIEDRYKEIIYIAGNHDFLFEKDPALAKTIMTNGLYLQNEAAIVEGKKFWGSPITPWFYDWAFNRGRGADIKRYWDMIPTDTDVLITHGPPMGILDTVLKDRWNPSRGVDHVGCQDLLEAVKRIKPKLHVFGHLHDGYGQVEQDGTIFVNASSCDEDYMASNAPIVIDLP